LCYNYTESPLDQHIARIKALILPLFIRKWSQHNHAKSYKSTCSLCWIADGLWKTTRFRCIYSDEETDCNTPEFKNIELGCDKSPEPGSYFCKLHAGFEMKFKFNNLMVSINPTLIIPLRLGNHIPNYLLNIKIKTLLKVKTK
jgi:hypothetical protein